MHQLKKKIHENPEEGEIMGETKKLEDIKISNEGIKELRDSLKKSIRDFKQACKKYGLSEGDGTRRALFDYDGR